MRGKKSLRGVSPLEEVTVERTLVSSMDKTTAPFAKRAILPVSSVMVRLAISNSSVKDSRSFVPEPTPEQMVRKPSHRHVGRVRRRSGFALLIRNAMVVMAKKLHSRNLQGTC